MGKGAVDDRSHLSLMAVGLQARDHVLDRVRPGRPRHRGRLRPRRVRAVPLEPGRPQADRPHRHAAGRGRRAPTSRRSSSSATSAARWSGCSRRRCPGGVGGRTASQRHESRETLVHADLRTSLLGDLTACETDAGYPIKPQRAIYELRRALGPDDIVVSDVGAHKIWIARLYQAYEPNTVVISNGFAAMGIALPGAIAAKLVHPDRKVVALCGDGGFLMNAQELETAKRIGAAVVVVVWRDDGYGLIDWKQRNEFGRPFAVEFGNPDLVDFARSFGIPGFRPASADDLYPTLMRALELDGPAVIDVPIDYARERPADRTTGGPVGARVKRSRALALLVAAIVAACQPAASREPTFGIPLPTSPADVDARSVARARLATAGPTGSPVASVPRVRHVGEARGGRRAARRRARTTPGRSRTTAGPPSCSVGGTAARSSTTCGRSTSVTERWRGSRSMARRPRRGSATRAAWLPGHGLLVWAGQAGSRLLRRPLALRPGAACVAAAARRRRCPGRALRQLLRHRAGWPALDLARLHRGRRPVRRHQAYDFDGRRAGRTRRRRAPGPSSAASTPAGGRPTGGSRCTAARRPASPRSATCGS